MAALFTVCLCTANSGQAFPFSLSARGGVSCTRATPLVDADEQATATDFTTLRTEWLGNPGYTAISLTGIAVRTHILRLAPKYQDIIIDAGGRDTTSLRAALTVADTALIPFQTPKL